MAQIKTTITIRLKTERTDSTNMTPLAVRENMEVSETRRKGKNIICTSKKWLVSQNFQCKIKIKTKINLKFRN